GTGSATPGSQRQDFSFDIKSDLTGTFSLTDWSVVRGPTTVGTLTISASDPATFVAAFRDGSSACADPTRGVEVDGTGRLDTGVLLSFTIFLCDNGASGSNTDFFHIRSSDGGYDRSGTLSSGDVVKTGNATATSSSARLTGNGSIGPGTQTVGSDRQDFIFDFNATPGGTMRYTDWKYALTADSGQYVTVDPVKDPATKVTSFYQTSATCVRISGIGRVNGVSTFAFYLDACDNANPGTGFDTFSMTVPDLDGQNNTYRESGTVTSGDIAFTGGNTPPTTGTLNVTTTTTGSSLDPDGYTVTVDGANGTAIADNGSQSFANLSSGSHSVAISGVASNCTVSGGTTQTANVPAGGSASVAFQINCVTQPTTGTLNVTTTTTGSSLDPDGYAVAVDGANSTAIADNGSQSFANLSSGNHTVTISGVAANCTVSGGTSQTANVPAGGSASVAFQVSCVAPQATHLAFSVQPSNATAGSAISPAVQVRTLDASGTVATSYSGTITIALGSSPSGATLSGTTTVSVVNGVATFSNLTLTKAGSGYTLTASASGLTGATSASFGVSAASASALFFTVQPSNTQTATAISPAVQVTARDAYGNTATSFNGSLTMALGRNPSGGTLSGTKTVSASNGVATFSNLQIDRAGNGYSLQVSGSSVTGAESAQFNVTQKPLICILGICI
ncbi:MAG TPA: hypothetical protein VJN70_18760, partial [Gemmatimonadaceae bacterium]|nr:hypothetical protein [Gemmatimonadaceae bacterium]